MKPFLFCLLTTFGLWVTVSAQQLPFVINKGTAIPVTGQVPNIGGVPPDTTNWTWVFTVKPINSATRPSDQTDALIVKTANQSTSASTGGFSFLIAATGPGDEDALSIGATYKLTVWSPQGPFDGVVGRGNAVVFGAISGGGGGGSVDLTSVTTPLGDVQTRTTDTQTKVTTMVPSVNNALTTLQTGQTSQTGSLNGLTTGQTVAQSGINAANASLATNAANQTSQNTALGNLLTLGQAGATAAGQTAAQTGINSANASLAANATNQTSQNATLAALLTLAQAEAATTGPGTPSNLAATTPSSGSVTFTWTAPSPATGVTGYRLGYSTAPTNYTTLVNAGAALTVTVNGLTPGVPIYAVVQSHDSVPNYSLNSNSISVTPTFPPAPTSGPFGGARPAIGATLGVTTVLTASRYDYGGEGVGFHFIPLVPPLTPVAGAVTFRNPASGTDGAEFLKLDYDTSDTVNTTGFVIGSNATGHYVNYAISIPVAGRYDLKLREACGDPTGGSVHVEDNGTALGSGTGILQTGTWDTAASWTTVDLGTYDFTSGNHAIRLVTDAGYFDEGYLSFTAAPPVGTGFALAEDLTALPALGALSASTLVSGTVPILGTWVTAGGAKLQVAASADSTHVQLFNGGDPANTGISSISNGTSLTTLTGTNVPTRGLRYANGYQYGLANPPFATVIPTITQSTLTPGTVKGTVNPLNDGQKQVVKNPGAEFYVAARTDNPGNGGLGTANDPFDASTGSKLNTVLNNHGENNTLHFAAGTYAWTNGGGRAKLNLQLLGAGFDRTILVGPGNGTIFSHSSDNYHPDGFQVFDLTVDLNAAAPAAATTGGLFFRASNFIMERVHWKHFGENAGGEVFPFCMLGYPNMNITWHDSNYDRSLWDQFISSPTTGGNTLVSMQSTKQQGTYNSTCAITNCYMGPGVKAALGASYQHAFIAPTVSGCTVNDVDVAFYLEPEQWSGTGAPNQAPDPWATDDESYNIHDNTCINVNNAFLIVYSSSGQTNGTLGLGETAGANLTGTITFANNLVDNRVHTGTALNGAFNIANDVHSAAQQATEFAKIATAGIQPLPRHMINQVILTGNTYLGTGTNDKGFDLGTTWTATQVTITGNTFTGYGHGSYPAINLPTQSTRNWDNAASGFIINTNILNNVGYNPNPP